MNIPKLFLGLAAFGIANFSLIASPALADHHMAKAIKTSSAELKILTNAKGMSLYTLDTDKQGVSICNGKCAKLWPPFEATAKSMNEGAFSVITRNNGSKQWAHRGKPLYTWFKDKKAGDVTGDLVKGKTGLWHIARP
jgi:predicted lipoprotein with Yx(FWY)xxD motif